MRLEITSRGLSVSPKDKGGEKKAAFLENHLHTFQPGEKVKGKPAKGRKLEKSYKANPLTGKRQNSVQQPPTIA